MEKPVLIDRLQVHALNARPSIFTYLKQLKDRRHFIISDSKYRAFQTNRGTFLGKIWNILNPLIDAMTYGLIFGLLLKTSHGIDNFVGFLVIGVIYFGFISQGLNAGSGLIQSSKSMIQAFRFPKASLVIGRTIRAFLDNLPPALVAIFVALIFQKEEFFSWTVFLVVPIYLLLHIFICGLIFIVARASAVIPDLKALVRVFSRVWFYISGVFFSVERFATEPWIQTLMTNNPAYKFLESIRQVVIDQTVPALSTWLAISSWSVGLLVVGFVYFWRGETRYINV